MNIEYRRFFFFETLPLSLQMEGFWGKGNFTDVFVEIRPLCSTNKDLCGAKMHVKICHNLSDEILQYVESETEYKDNIRMILFNLPPPPPPSMSLLEGRAAKMCLRIHDGFKT